jgi:hypothetical protein
MSLTLFHVKHVKTAQMMPVGINGLPVKWVPFNHSMAYPQITDGGNGLLIWRVAANILNKQPIKDGPFDWGIGIRPITHHHKNDLCCKHFSEASNLDGSCEIIQIT